MNYRQLKNKSDWPWKSFDEFVDNGGYKSEINHYSVSLKRWLKYFNLNEILILTSEIFFSDTLNVLKRIEKKLNISVHNYSTEHWVAPYSNKIKDYPKIKEETRKNLQNILLHM